MDNDAPLIEAAKLFSEYIDNLAINEKGNLTFAGFDTMKNHLIKHHYIM